MLIFNKEETDKKSNFHSLKSKELTSTSLDKLVHVFFLSLTKIPSKHYTAIKN